MCADRKSFFDPYREPTEGEKEYIANRMAGMGKVKALELSSLPTTTTPDLKAQRLEELPHIKRYLVSVLEAAGVTDKRIAETINEGLDAFTTRVRKTGDKNNPLIEITDPDWPSRARFVEIALRAKGFTEKDTGDRTPSNITIINKMSMRRDDKEEEPAIEVGVEAS